MKKNFLFLIFILFFISQPIDALQKKYAIVNTKSGINLRSEPTINSKPLSIIPDEELVEIISIGTKKESIGNAQGYWYKIRWNSFVGYAFSGFLISDFKTTFFTAIITSMPKNLEKKYIITNGCFVMPLDAYMQSLEFKDNIVSYRYKTHAGINNCITKNSNDYSAPSIIFEGVKIGTYKKLKNFIVINFTNQKDEESPSENCINLKKSTTTKKINERYLMIPTVPDYSKDSCPGFIFFPDFGYSKNSFWAPEPIKK